MRVEHYIVELLHRYNCVIMPNFGAFLAHNSSAVLSPETGLITPPRKVLSFNAQLESNDGLLVKHIAKAKGLEYEDLLQNVLEVANSWREKIVQNQTLLLQGIGTFTQNSEGKLIFKPEEKVNYLTSAFGLSEVSISPVLREKLVAEVSAIENKTEITLTNQARDKKSNVPYLKYAAVFLLLTSLGGGIYGGLENHQKKQQIAAVKAQSILSEKIQQATFFDLEPITLPPLEIGIAKKAEPEISKSYHIIAGAFREEKNALKKLAQLRSEGFEATYLDKNRYGLHQIAYGSFVTQDEALKALQSIKRKSSDAWLLIQR